MQQIDIFQSHLRQVLVQMGRGNLKDAEVELKQLQKDVKFYLVNNKIVQNDRLAEIQIGIYNNLACICQSKRKYKSSLFHLQIAHKLQTAYFKHKYGENEDIPHSALEQLATTYSNLSAIYQKLLQPTDALNCIEFAVQLMQKHKDLQHSPRIVHLYYNYAILLESNTKYQQASKFAIAGKQAALKHRNDMMVRRYIQLLEKIKEHLARQEIRRHKTLKRYLVGQTGIVKPIENIFIENKDVTEQEKEKMKQFVNQAMAREHSSAQKSRAKSFFGPRNTLSKSYNLSCRAPNYRSLSSNISARVGKIKSNNMRSFNSSSNTINKETTLNGLIQAYGTGGKLPKGVNKSNQHYSIQPRHIKDRKKKKIQFQKGPMTQKNEVLEQIIQKLYLHSNRQS